MGRSYSVEKVRGGLARDDRKLANGRSCHTTYCNCFLYHATGLLFLLSIELRYENIMMCFRVFAGCPTIFLAKAWSKPWVAFALDLHGPNIHYINPPPCQTATTMPFPQSRFTPLHLTTIQAARSPYIYVYICSGPRFVAPVSDRSRSAFTRRSVRPRYFYYFTMQKPP